MKSWKEVPHLFSNGKFEVKNDHRGYFKFVGYHVWETTGKQLIDPIGNQYPLEYCTLIARPISDMSDEELRKWILFRSKGRITMLSRLEKEAKLETLRSKDFLYLLSIGVYPFDQSHFESGEVIARYENKKGEA